MTRHQASASCAALQAASRSGMPPVVAKVDPSLLPPPPPPTNPLPPRGRGDMPEVAESAAGRPALAGFRDFLENQSGAAPATVEVHMQWVRRLLALQAEDAPGPDGAESVGGFLEAVTSQPRLTALWHSARDEFGHGTSSLLKAPSAVAAALDYADVRMLAKTERELSLVRAQRANLKGVRKCINKDAKAAERAPRRGRSLEQLQAAGLWIDAKSLQERVLRPALKQYRALVSASTASANGRDHRPPFALSATDTGFVNGFVVLALAFGGTALRTGALAQATLGDAREAVRSGQVALTRFKTSATYASVVLDASAPWLRAVLQDYVEVLRPAMRQASTDDGAPFLANSAGTAEKNLATQLGKVTKRHAGVQLSLNRLRQVFETHAMDQYTPAEQEAASRAQAHSSNTARLHYKKKKAGQAASESRAAAERTLGAVE